MLRSSLSGVVLLGLIVAPGPLPAQNRAEDTRFRSGNIVVKRAMEHMDGEGGQVLLRHHVLLRDQIDFGRVFDDVKYRRMPITYYHPQGPVGLAFARLNWFPGAANTYHADARLPASLVGLSATSGALNLPLTPMLGVWSEPPVAVIGMNAGTPAAYARPFQHLHFYEPNKDVIQLNERTDGERVFHFLPDARARGAAIHVFHGPPRQQLREHGPRGFYRLMIMEACSGEDGEKLFLDLFTKEGIAQCMEHLVENGVLCGHTSHRFIELPPVVAAIGKALKLHVRRGFDHAPGSQRWRDGGKVTLEHVGQFTSEWVLLARRQSTLDAICKAPANYEELLKKNPRPFGNPREEYWNTPLPHDHVWTDKGPNLLHGILRGHPVSMRYSAVAVPCADALMDLLPAIGLGAPAVRDFVMQLSNLPHPVQDLLVREQLKRNPQVEKLWR